MLLGIDVSHHNGSPDFSKAKSVGVSFVYVKATEGTSYIDPMFQPNMFNALRAGLPVGAYHFGRPCNDPQEEADHFVKQISIFKYHLLPVLDLEVDEGQDGESLYQWARAFVSRVKEKTGHNCLLYTGLSFLNQFPELKKLNDLPLWIAAYRAAAPAVSGWKDWAIWQYSETASIPGVGKCDANWAKDLNTIMIGGGSRVVAQTQNNKILLKRGSTGDLVKQLQQRLQIAVDGVFGPLTEESVKQWQKAHGLTVDGIVGPVTWNALFPPAKPPDPMYRVTVDGNVVVDTAYPEKVAAAVQAAVAKGAKDITVKPL